MLYFVFICVIIKIYHLYLLCIFTFTYLCIPRSHFSFTYFKNISHFPVSFTYISLSNSLLSIFNITFASHTFSISLLRTLKAFVPCGYVVTPSNACNLLSSTWSNLINFYSVLIMVVTSKYLLWS